MIALVLADQDRGVLSPATARAVTAAKALGGDVHVLVAGRDVAGAAEAAAKLDGVDKVLVADAPHYENMLAEEIAALVASLMDGYDAALAPATTTGKNVMPRVAALIDAMQISDISAVLSPDTFERPIYAGNAIETVQSSDARKIVTVRTTAFAPAGDGGSAPVETVEAPAPLGLSEFVSADRAETGRPDLGAARIVISGGRGLKAGENFKTLLEPIADRLGAAIGASRAAVDAGYMTNDHQVGQTGKVVAPELYIAVGISGAIQHLAGMKDSKVIVAINKDEEAPIFQVADYGLVADLFTALPELEAELQKAGYDGGA
jgi:electron transfer flavoprotein alpha subunit